MNSEHVISWLNANPLSPIHVDCVIAVMLKILDGKCKMRDHEKQVMKMLYEAIKTLPGQWLDASLHALIASAKDHADDALKNLIYEQRLLAETSISRPVMKGFKVMLRETGLLDATVVDAADNPE